MDGKQIAIHDRNPFLRGDVEDDAPSTLLNIDDLPWSCSQEALDRHLRNMGLKLRTKIKWQCDRNPRDGGLTEFRTGKRTVWINLPTNPLPRKIKVGEFQASLYHFEMKAQAQEQGVKCRKCLETGHKAFECPNEEVCYTCHLPGHKKGDRKCKGASAKNDNNNSRDNEKKQDQKNYYCEWCKDYGHFKNDINDCIFHVPGWRQGEPHPWLDKQMDEVNTGKTAVCAKCGLSGHTEGEVSCQVEFPPIRPNDEPTDKVVSLTTQKVLVPLPAPTKQALTKVPDTDKVNLEAISAKGVAGQQDVQEQESNQVGNKEANSPGNEETEDSNTKPEDREVESSGNKGKIPIPDDTGLDVVEVSPPVASSLDVQMDCTPQGKVVDNIQENEPGPVEDDDSTLLGEGLRDTEVIAQEVNEIGAPAGGSTEVIGEVINEEVFCKGLPIIPPAETGGMFPPQVSSPGAEAPKDGQGRLKRSVPASSPEGLAFGVAAKNVRVELDASF